jgi:hypothetical protein
MMTKKAKPAGSKALSDSGAPSSAYHRLAALLHTVQCIARYEDSLCELSHEAKPSGRLSPQASEELRLMLEKIPSHDYLLDLDAVRELLQKQPSSKKASKKPSGSKPSSVSTKTNFAGHD